MLRVYLSLWVKTSRSSDPDRNVGQARLWLWAKMALHSKDALATTKAPQIAQLGEVKGLCRWGTPRSVTIL